VTQPAALGPRYAKGHGTENDFVILDDPDGLLEISAGLVAALCDRQGGLGADGVLRVVRTAAFATDGASPATLAGAVEHPAAAAPATEWFMDYRNADGSIAEMCGNGIRVYARYLLTAGYAASGRLRLGTRAGTREVDIPAQGDISVAMGVPTLLDVQATVVGRPVTAVSLGNPHAVVELDGAADPLAALDLRRPPDIDPVDAFPEGVNVEFVVRCGPGQLALRVHERGVGETRSCGTGVCAAAFALSGGEPGRWTVDVPGGRLQVTLDAAGAMLCGPAVLVATGHIDPTWWEEHA